VLRRTFGPNGEEVAGGWRRLHDKELRNLYTVPNIIRAIKKRRMRWAVHVALMGKMRNACNILVRKTECKRPLEKSRRRLEDNIRIDLGEIGWEGVNWMYLAQDRDQC